MANTTLTRNATSIGDTQKGTYSCWIKRGDLSREQMIFTWWGDSGNYQFHIEFESDDKLEIKSWDYNTTDLRLVTNRQFRDTNAWYHIVAKIDTTQSTASDRVRLYINGVEETSFATSNYPSQNHTMQMNGANTTDPRIGSHDASNRFFNGSMSHLHWIDGTAYDASSFGSVDSVTGEWKINTSPSVTYGTNGFFILKDGNSVTDQSGNGNNFTVAGGTLTKTEDCPSNVFATWNSILPLNSTMTLANGNTTGTTASNYASGASNSFFSTLGMSSGKYYAEFKYVSSSTNDGSFIGVGYDLSKQQQGLSSSASNFCQNIPEGYGYAPQGEVFNNGGTAGYSTYTTGDIIGVAIDCDNNTLNFYKNGASAGNQINITSDKEYFFALSDGTSANTFTYSANFGNGYFGTTAVSSAGTNASGLGIFEYDVPSGYTALCTKGLNE